jgi:MSHA biogenesis protein MshO
MRRKFNPLTDLQGFTLLEMIVVIVVTGIIGGAVAVFVRTPVQAYLDTVGRAALSDAGDLALKRITRDLRTALPNSVRVTTSGTTTYLEFLQVRTGGRYRAVPDSSGLGDILDLSAADTAFDTSQPLSVLTDEVILNTDRVVIYNLGIPGADAYNGDNSSLISSTAAGALANEGRINFAAKQFPLASPGNRYQVISGPVTYGCDTATGLITRYWGYAIAAVQPKPPAGAGLSTAILVGESNGSLPLKVASCQFTYTNNAVAQRNGLVLMQLQLQKNNESVRLFQQAHVSNVP